MTTLLSDKRKKLHRDLLQRETLSMSPANAKTKKFGVTHVASNADAGQKSSVLISNCLLDKVARNAGVSPLVVEKKKDGQTLGNEFEELCAEFVDSTFGQLSNLRPGNWIVEKVGSRSDSVLGRFEQYTHLAELSRLAQDNLELRNFMGDSYTVAPDVIVARQPEKDEKINESIAVVDGGTCLRSMLRRANHIDPENPSPILHASISCKFTMRSDRSQNTRTEALNLLRGRKGRAPHIVSVTSEPMPSRIASLALGTGDLDCVYHFALYELQESLVELEKDDQLDFLQSMIEGKRLKDISDLPLDLSV